MRDNVADSKCFSRNRWLLLLFVLHLSQPCDSAATSIVCIRSPDSIVLAADSMLTIKHSAGSEMFLRECKIHRTGDIVFALAGFCKDPSQGYDLLELVADTIRADMTLLDAAEAVENVVSANLRNELVKLKSESPELFSKYVKGRTGKLVKILLTRYEDGVPKVAFLGFSEVESPSGEIFIRAERTSCPGDCKPQSVSAFFMTDKAAIDQYLNNGGKLDWLAPEKAAKKLVELVIEGRAPGVGPPVDVLRIDGNGVVWVERKPECPDYDDSETNYRDFDR